MACTFPSFLMPVCPVLPTVIEMRSAPTVPTSPFCPTGPRLVTIQCNTKTFALASNLCHPTSAGPFELPHQHAQENYSHFKREHKTSGAWLPAPPEPHRAAQVICQLLMQEKSSRAERHHHEKADLEPFVEYAGVRNTRRGVR